MCRKDGGERLISSLASVLHTEEEMIEIKSAEDCLTRIKGILPEREYEIVLTQIKLLVAQEVLQAVQESGHKDLELYSLRADIAIVVREAEELGYRRGLIDRGNRVFNNG